MSGISKNTRHQNKWNLEFSELDDSSNVYNRSRRSSINKVYSSKPVSRSNSISKKIEKKNISFGEALCFQRSYCNRSSIRTPIFDLKSKPKHFEENQFFEKLIKII